MLINEQEARNIAAEDARKDSKNPENAHLLPECWQKWQTEHECESDAVVKDNIEKLKDFLTQSNMLESQTTALQREDQKLEESKQGAKQKNIDAEIQEIEEELISLENTFEKNELHVGVSTSTYRKLMISFGVLEIPLNWVAFQSLEIASVATIAAITIVVGILLICAAHFVGQTIKQFPPRGRTNNGRTQAIGRIIFWGLSIASLYYFITTFREVGLEDSSNQLFWFMMTINVMLFAVAITLSYRAHHLDPTDDQRFKQQEDKINELQEELNALRKKSDDREDDTEQRIEKISATLTKNEQKKIAVNGEYQKLFALILKKQEEIDNQLQLSIQHYRDEYAQRFQGGLPDWMSDDPCLHIDFLKPEDLQDKPLEGISS